MDKIPLVSITMAAYNHERYVQEAIRSVIEQDYPRMELIVIDDGSRDSTWTKIEALRPECEKRFERVVMYTRENRGRVATLSELDGLVRGDYYGAVASDDQYLPGAISALVSPMAEDNAIGLTVGTNIIIDGNGQRCYWDEQRNNVYDKSCAKWCTFDEFIKSYSHIDVSSEAFGAYGSFVKCNHVGNGQLWRRSFVQQLAAPYHEKAPLEDLWFHLQLSKVAKYRHVNVPTFAYRWHGANTVTQTEYMNRIYGETLRFEFDCVRRRGTDDIKDAWRWRQPYVDCVFRLRLGKHCPSIRRVVSVDWTQYVANVHGRDFPLTPKLPV